MLHWQRPQRRVALQLREGASSTDGVDGSPLASAGPAHAQLEAQRARQDELVARLEERERKLIDGHNAKTTRLRKELRGMHERLNATPSVTRSRPAPFCPDAPDSTPAHTAHSEPRPEATARARRARGRLARARGGALTGQGRAFMCATELACDPQPRARCGTGDGAVARR